MSNEGVKYDGEKVRWDLLPGDALEEIAKVLTVGAKKYGDRNWELGMNWSRPFAAMMRHGWAWFRGEDYDQETGLLHIAQAACNAIFLLTYVIRDQGTDDRPISWWPLRVSVGLSWDSHEHTGEETDNHGALIYSELQAPTNLARNTGISPRAESHESEGLKYHNVSEVS